MIPVLILAGGKATRLGPLTEHMPKSLVEVAGRPFIEHQLELLARNGLTSVVLATGHLGKQLVKGIDLYRTPGISSIRFLYEDTPLGTGGAIKAALPFLSPSFFVLYGDSYLDCNYTAVYKQFIESNRFGLMTICEAQDLSGNVVFDGQRIVGYNKNHSDDMEYQDYGLSVLTHFAFEGFDETAFDLSLVYQRLIQRRELSAYVVKHRFYEIGSPEGLAETRAYLEGNR
jgi:MurNAc alpha-1-phosphate uridylyltransferase